MDAACASQLQQAEQTPAWDLQALRKALVAAADAARIAALSAEEEQRFNELCRHFRERLRNLMPSA